MNSIIFIFCLLLFTCPLSNCLPNEKQIREELFELGRKKYGSDSKKMFTAYDRNEDGKLDDSEVRVMLQEAGGYNWLLGTITHRLIHALDKNGDHAVSYEEIPTE